MAKVTVVFWNPLDGASQSNVIDAELVNVTELGAYTIVGSGKLMERTREPVAENEEPSTYQEMVGIGELRIPTQFVQRIDIEYGTPEA